MSTNIPGNPIAKSTFTFVVVHRADVNIEEWDIADVVHECDTGHMVGAVVRHVEESVPNKDVPAELMKIGNDGEFFDPDIEDALEVAE